MAGAAAAGIWLNTASVRGGSDVDGFPDGASQGFEAASLENSQCKTFKPSRPRLRARYKTANGKAASQNSGIATMIPNEIFQSSYPAGRAPSK